MRYLILLLLAFLPASALAQPISGYATTANPTYAPNSVAPMSLDLNGNHRVVTVDGVGVDATGTFTNATQATSVTSGTIDGYGTVTVTINGTYNTATAVFEQSDDGGVTFYGTACALQGTVTPTLQLGYTSLTNTSSMWRCSVNGSDSFRVRSTAVSSGTVNVRISISASSTPNGSTVGAVTSLASGTTVAIDQTTPGTTNGVQVNAALPAGTNTIGGVTQTPTTSGGTSISSNLVANNHTSVAIKASAGQVFGIEAFNNGATIAYLKLYNAAQGSTTCGSGTPVARYMIPAATAGGAGFISMNVNGDAYSTAISSCVVTGIADNDASDPAATTYLFNVHIK